ncbi:KpsF/GutQ family sugar-phosphate isomerase [Entomobacter blattae]|uniref:Arabinose 5-phosphate isomerase KdsD n=1 Tax=Entomobacter blattae TaxID=2762277 RepID=A0A7H1NSN7_9PROT|nr:KpsF/GutQ family sugar-phosphate isomerase [Entomobacter blattae]QNT78797.1 Arabinose 5-phosphate isomerase KdsD [Entomobacter blattae]
MTTLVSTEKTCDTDIALAYAFLKREQAGLQTLLEKFSPSSLVSQTGETQQQFQTLIQALADLKGRIVVTGIGKSGHIGKKIQATLASTGSPSLFIHPSEASHGDLGMVQKEDAILAISASGETAELSHIITYAKRIGILLCCITFSAHSTLAKASDIALILPTVQEACPMGLAPTTTSLMQLAIGDAIAVVLLQKKGFTPHDFSLFHPGGTLGAKLAFVKDLMHTGKELPLVSPSTLMHEAILEITQKAFGCLGVVSDDGKLVGIITDGDLRRVLYTHANTLHNLTAEAVMNVAPLTITADMLAADALRIMNDPAKPVTCLFIINQNHRPMGIIHIHDLLRAGLT